jgi:hypothetical protein
VVWVAKNLDVAKSWCALRAQSLEGMLCMHGIASQGSLDFLVHDHKDLDSFLGFSLEELIQPVVPVIERGASQEEFRRQPPVCNVDGLFGLLESHRDSPEIVTAIHIPFD